MGWYIDVFILPCMLSLMFNVHKRMYYTGITEVVSEIKLNDQFRSRKKISLCTPPHFCSFPHFCHQRMSECTISKILTKNISMYHLTAATNRYINVQSHSCHQRIYQCTIPQLPRLYTNVPSYSFHQRIYQCTVPQLPPKTIPMYHPTAATK